MEQSQYQGATMVRAFFNDGSNAVVQFWVPAGDKAHGYGIRNGQMILLDSAPDFSEYSQS